MFTKSMIISATVYHYSLIAKTTTLNNADNLCNT